MVEPEPAKKYRLRLRNTGRGSQRGVSEFSGKYAEGSVRSGLRGEIVGCSGDRGEGGGTGWQPFVADFRQSMQHSNRDN